MIGRKDMPASFVEWNRRWGAPYGHDRFWQRALARLLPADLVPVVVGPFGFQADNCETRRFEYPWAYHCTPLGRGMSAVDVGASLSGFQFVLARTGLDVINVDPGDSATMGWPLDERSFTRLNRAFRTHVQLRRCFLHEAGIADDSVDRVYCISTIEHIPEDELPRLLAEIRRVLKPSGRAVLSVDLFLDLWPFTHRTTNPSGHNVDIRWLVDESKLDLVAGTREELHGFDEFEPDRILSQLGEYIYGSRVPALAQTLVLGKE
jgi:SAM-dependent methyltransferase